MAYTIYQTDVVILGVREIQEHDLLVRVFSSMFGYMRVIAKGTRHGKSKLRAHIQEYSMARIAVVRGKEMFRLTDANHVFSFTQSRSVVSFLRYAETLFFDDENEYGTDTTKYIYEVLLQLCKLFVHIGHTYKTVDAATYEMIKNFFTVYVRGLQGFLSKIDMSNVQDMTSQELYMWIQSRSEEIQTLLRKDMDRVV